VRGSSAQSLARGFPVAELGVQCLPHEPLSAGLARAHVRAAVSGWTDQTRVRDALLLTTELVANAITHGGPAVILRSSLVGGRLRVEVFDAAAGHPRMRATWAGSGRGRGLAIVDELADGWGVLPSPAGGKTVWFELLA